MTFARESNQFREISTMLCPSQALVSVHNISLYTLRVDYRRKGRWEQVLFTLRPESDCTTKDDLARESNHFWEISKMVCPTQASVLVHNTFFPYIAGVLLKERTVGTLTIYVAA